MLEGQLREPDEAVAALGGLVGMAFFIYRGNYIAAGIFGAVCLAGGALRAYHQIAMSRWHQAKHGIGKGKKRRADDDE